MEKCEREARKTSTESLRARIVQGINERLQRHYAQTGELLTPEEFLALTPGVYQDVQLGRPVL